MRPKNKQNELVRCWLLEALLKLLEQKEMEKISITELVNKAGVSRMGFYRNYQIKQDILIEHLLEKLDYYWPDTSPIQLYNFPLFAKQLFVFGRENQEMLELLIVNNYAYFIILALERKIVFSSKKVTSLSERSEKYLPQFILGGIISILVEWIEGGLKETDREMSEVVISFIESYFLV